MEKHKVVLGVVAVLAVIVFLFTRKSGQATSTVYAIPNETSGSGSDAGDGDNLALAAIAADTLKSQLSFNLESNRLEKESALQLAQVNVARDIGLSTSEAAVEADRFRAETEREVSLRGFDVQREIGLAESQAQREIASINREVSLATINASVNNANTVAESAARNEAARIQAQLDAQRQQTEQARIQAEAQQQQANSQRNSNIFSTILSTVPSILGTIFGRNERSSGTGSIPIGGTPPWYGTFSGGLRF